VHDGREALFTCSRCGTFACDECLFSRLPAREICRSCAAKGLGEPIPWERRAELGRVKAFLETTKTVMRAPRAFFRTPETEQGLLWPGIYGIVAYTVGQLFYLLEIAAFLLLGAAGVAIAGVEPIVAGVLAGYAVLVLVVGIPMTLVQSPFYGLLGILAGGGLTHLTLKAMKRANASFEQTVRAVSFANAPYVLYFIPCAGPFIAWIWMICIETIGVREVHGITTDRALIAVLAYRLLFIGLIITLYVAMVAFMIFLERGQRGGF
jgi:hypothetical protein